MPFLARMSWMMVSMTSFLLGGLHAAFIRAPAACLQHCPHLWLAVWMLASVGALTCTLSMHLMRHASQRLEQGHTVVRRPWEVGVKATVVEVMEGEGMKGVEESSWP